MESVMGRASTPTMAPPTPQGTPLRDVSQQDIEVATAIVENPIHTFVPTGIQEEFLQMDRFVQVYSAANYVGKTTVGVMKLGAMLFRPENVFLKMQSITRFKRRVRFRIVSDHTAIESDLIPNLKRWFPKGQYTALKGNRAFESRWTTSSGAVGDIMTYDQDPREFEAVKLDVVLFDEPPPLRILNATIARMRPGGIIMITMTPLSRAGHIFDKARNPWSEKNWGFIYADAESACTEHGIRGYWPHAEIEKKTAEYDDEEKEARIQGRPVHLAGLVYKSWQRKIHVIKPIPIPLDWAHYCILDPHDRKPFAFTWAVVAPNEKVYVIDEYPNEPFHLVKSSQLTVRDYANVVKAREEGMRIYMRIIDARYGKRHSSQTGYSIRDLLDQEGLVFQDSYLDDGGLVDHGHQQVKELLKLGSDGLPGLMVFDHCFNHIYGFEHYTWADYARVEGRGLKEKPREEHKDYMDNIRYLAMELPFGSPMDHAHAREGETLPKWVTERAIVGVAEED